MWNYLIAGALVVAGFASNQPQVVPPRADGAVPTGLVGAPAPGSTGLHAGQSAPRTKDPYARLFPVKDGRLDVRTLTAAQALNRKTVCGLTVWNVAPDADSRIILRPSASKGDFTIKKLAPPVCQE
jgi:hypothetical protein